MRLTGNTVLVTGGGSGIGRGLAVALHEAGNRVVIAGRRIEALRAVADEHPGIGYLQLDQTDRQSIRRFVDELSRRHPELNVVINNAGVMALEDLSEPDPDVASAVIATNLLGPIVLTSLLMPTLMARRSRQSSTSRPRWPSSRWLRADLQRHQGRITRLHRIVCVSSCRTAEFRSSRSHRRGWRPTWKARRTTTYTMSVDDFIAETLSLLAGRPGGGRSHRQGRPRIARGRTQRRLRRKFAAVNPHALAAARKEICEDRNRTCPTTSSAFQDR